MYFYCGLAYNKIVHLLDTKSNIMSHPGEGQPTTPEQAAPTEAELRIYEEQVQHIPRIFEVNVPMVPGEKW